MKKKNSFDVLCTFWKIVDVIIHYYYYILSLIVLFQINDIRIRNKSFCETNTHACVKLIAVQIFHIICNYSFSLKGKWKRLCKNITGLLTM